MIIYTDSQVCESVLEKKFTILNNLYEYSTYSCDKLAVLHAPFPRHTDFIDLARIFRELHDSSKKIILLVSELHDVTVDFIQEFDQDKIVYFLNGDLNISLDHAKSYRWMNWFATTTEFYKKNIFLLDKLTPYKIKPKFFDVLLGQERPHRSELFNNCKEISDQLILTYINGIQPSLQDRGSNEWLWEHEGLEIPDWPMRHTITKVKYYDQLISLSQIIPVSIYNQTAYTVVAETWGTDNRFTFNTEKIVKPILAERLFLVASNQYYLHNLRNMGFLTFDGIIDESYDSEPDYVKRCNLIIEQMKYLMSQPQEIILEKIKPIAEHNRRLMLETDWYGDFSRELQAVLLDHTS